MFDKEKSVWGNTHPKSLWQSVAMPNFVEGEVIDIEKTLETVLAFAKLGVSGVYILLDDRDTNNCVYVEMQHFIDYLSKVKEKAWVCGTLNPKYCPVKFYVHRKECGKTWSLQRAEDDEPTWEVTSYAVNELNMKSIKKGGL